MATHHPHSHELIHEPQNEPTKTAHKGPVSHVDHPTNQPMKDQVPHNGMSAGNHMMKGHHEKNADGTVKNPTHSALGQKDLDVNEDDESAAKKTEDQSVEAAEPTESHNHAKQEGTDNVYNFAK